MIALNRILSLLFLILNFSSVSTMTAAFEDQAPSPTAALGCAWLLTDFFAHHLDLSNKNGQMPLHVAAECG